MKLLLVFGVLALSFVMGEFTCFSCDNCGDPFDAKVAEKKTCQERCLKTIIEITNGQPITSRTCNVPPQVPLEGISAVHLHLCESNFCNGSASITPALLLMLLAIIAALVGINQH